MVTKTSELFFASWGIGSLLGRRPISVEFIDGLHLFETTLTCPDSAIRPPDG
jgi:hypothetical protein